MCGALFLGVAAGAHGFEEKLGGAFGFEAFDGGAGSEGAVEFVVDDLFHEGPGGGLLDGAGKVEAGDLEAVEQQAGAAGVEVVGGDALQDLAERELEGGAVFGPGEVEDGEACLARGGVFDGTAGGVVEVAEVLVAKTGAAAAAAFGEDVAALKAPGCVLSGVLVAAEIGLRHDVPLPRVFWL